MIEIQAPREYNPRLLFLAGSIENGKATEWQKIVVKELEHFDVVIYNPRRNDWDSTWTEDSPLLKTQIRWELEHIEKSDIIFFYFDPTTISPISLLEFGKVIGDESKQKIIVCPPGFHRRTNVIETANFYNESVFNTLDEGIDALKRHYLL